MNQKKMVDELNVFPVPDGDTGANMSATINSVRNEFSVIEPDENGEISVGEVAEKTASAMLRGARGNSGVILSLLFRGLSKGLNGKVTCTAMEFCEALEIGVHAAYKSVMKPTEGTILTVAREATQSALKAAVGGGSFTEVFAELVKSAGESLDRTPELLPVLQKAGVVDAGGMGYLCILEGMRAVVEGRGIIESESDGNGKPSAVITNAAGSFEGEITFTYCTEFLVRRKSKTQEVLALRAYLESIGDSVVVVDDDDIIKVHVHTDNPGDALQKGLEHGELINIKIENMREQHKEEMLKVERQKDNRLAPRNPEEKYGFVSVVSGAGLEALFLDLGVMGIVRGGQTSNPSTDDIVEAILATPAHNVFVLPNNKNIILAAEQAQKLVKDRNVVVLQSRTVPQGISAILSFDGDLDVRENSVQMTLALDKVDTGLITFAVRDSDFEDKKIKKNDVLAMENGRLSFIEKDVTRALLRLTKKMVRNDSKFVTVIYGIDVPDTVAEEAFAQLKSKLRGDVEINLVNGGQPVYYYIVSVE